MNKIYNLFEEKFIIDLFNKEVLPLYPNFSGINKVEIIPVKRLIWETTYHVVMEFRTTFTAGGQNQTLPIYCTAHSDEPRLNAYEALTFLWQNGFSRGDLTIPRPLFYSTDFKASFYQGVRGHNLYYFIRQKNLKAIESIIVKTAAWFVKLHGLATTQVKNYNPANSRVETIIPGMANALRRIKLFYPRYFEVCRQIYENINQRESQFFSTTNQLWLIHGDAHPENVISLDQNRLAVIDFTDVCLADFTRDLGSFSQQFEFMGLRKINNPAYIEKIKQLFLTSYFNRSKIKLNQTIKDRLDNYYNWTALRTAIFFLLKDKSEPERAHGLLVKISQDLGLNINI